MTRIEGNSFDGCGSLKTVVIPDSALSIGDQAFAACSVLESVVIGENSQLQSIGESAFSGCTSLKTITIPKSVMNIGDAVFLNCNRLSDIAVNEKNENYCNDSYGVLFNKDKTVLLQYPVGNERKSYIIPDSVKTIASFSFDSCNSIVSVILPVSIEEIGFGAFDCENLIDVCYKGNVDEWKCITIAPQNSCLFSGTAVKYDYYISGDADEDGKITSGDARIVLRAVYRLDELNADLFKIADVDKDNVLTAEDAYAILRCAVGLETLE